MVCHISAQRTIWSSALSRSHQHHHIDNKPTIGASWYTIPIKPFFCLKNKTAESKRFSCHVCRLCPFSSHQKLALSIAKIIFAKKLDKSHKVSIVFVKSRPEQPQNVMQCLQIKSAILMRHHTLIAFLLLRHDEFVFLVGVAALCNSDLYQSKLYGKWTHFSTCRSLQDCAMYLLSLGPVLTNDDLGFVT